MSVKILEFLIVLVVLFTLGILIIRLYRENERAQKVNSLFQEHNNTLKSKLIKTEQEKENLNQNLEEYQKKFEKFKEIENSYNTLLGKHQATVNELEDLREVVDKSTMQLLEMKAIQERTKSLQEALKEKEELVAKLKEDMGKEFKNLTNELLEQKRDTLKKENSESIKQLLEPFDKDIKGFKERLEKLNQEQSQSVSMLRGELLQIKELNKTLSNEAKELARALKGDNKLQGNWGELILERALEATGLREGIEYKREQVFKDENGTLRADVVLYLPENKHIVIDSKVSLNSYTQILKAQNEEEKRVAKNNHIISIKRHIDTLASKQYHMLNSLKSPEFTLMFIPIEAAYLMALEIDNSLYEYAFERNVAVVTPTTLYTTLKTVSTLWRLANHDKNMQTIAQEAGALHDKFALFLEDFLQIENRLHQAQTSFISAKNRLHTGSGSLHSKIEKIGKLSGKSKKELPKISS